MALTQVQTGMFDASNVMFRNRIINGDMRIDQRNAGAAVTSNGAFPVDRMRMGNSTNGAFSAQQDSSAPDGFVNSVKVTTTTADGTLTGTQNLQFTQRIEGTNIADLGWGSANAKTVTLSFWVRSSLTGTFGGSLRNNDGTRSYPYTYTISVADTWEYKTVTVEGETSGTWLTTTDIGLIVFFGLGTGPDLSGTAGAWNSNNNTSATGAVSVIGTLNATWYVTGVQLEVGSTATPFERRPYGQELALCQRYCYVLGLAGENDHSIGVGHWFTTSYFRTVVRFPTEMRAGPSITPDVNTNNYRVISNNSNIYNNTLSVGNIRKHSVIVFNNSGWSTSATAGHGGDLFIEGVGAKVIFSAEL